MIIKGKEKNDFRESDDDNGFSFVMMYFVKVLNKWKFIFRKFSFCKVEYRDEDVDYVYWKLVFYLEIVFCLEDLMCCGFIGSIIIFLGMKLKRFNSDSLIVNFFFVLLV